jgi:predicted PurR-regulated permease PerM
MTSILITGLLVTISLYFLLRHGEDWIGRLAVVIPLDPGVTASLFKTVRDSVIANVNGVLAVAAGQGLLLGLGFWFVGVRSPVLWGAVGGLASIIPVVGSPLVWVPVVIAFVFMGSYWKALLLGLWGALVVGSVDNVLRPFVVRARDKQHPMLIALAAIGGTYAFGVLGILLGPLVVSLVAALLKEIQELASPSREHE